MLACTRRLCLIPLVAGSLLAVAGCGGKAEPPPAPSLPEVFVTHALQGEVTDFEVFTGRTEAEKSVVIRARVTGYLDKVYFSDGQDVKEGAPLFQIDDRTFRADLAKAEANLRQAETTFERLERDYQRAQQVVNRQAISRQEFDKAVSDRDEAAAHVQQMKSAVAREKVNMSYTTINAPISGRLSRTYIDAHNLVKADDTILTTVVKLDPMYAYFDVDERTLLRIRRQLQLESASATPIETVAVQVGLADEEGFPHAGAVNFVDNQVDLGTGTLRFRCVLENPRLLLSPGLFVRVRLPIGQPHGAVLVPEKAIGTDQGQKFVFTIGAQHDVIYRPVELGGLHGGWRVVRGVKPDEAVIVSGLQRVRAGSKAQVKPASRDSLPKVPADVQAARAAKAP